MNKKKREKILDTDKQIRDLLALRCDIKNATYMLSGEMIDKVVAILDGRLEELEKIWASFTLAEVDEAIIGKKRPKHEKL